MNHSENPLLVLLVEDSEDDAFFFKLAVEKTGVNCQVVHVVDGKAALEYLERVQSGSLVRQPDLVFLDLKLPLLSGFEVLEWIARHTYDPPLRISVLSGSDHVADMERARALGVGDYIVKPISSQDLMVRMNRALSPAPVTTRPIPSLRTSASTKISF